jgi:hypothetical protein
MKMTKEAAASRIEVLKGQYYKIEQEMIGLALEHDVDLYLGGLGNLLLKTDPWTGKERGEWFTSTDSCN